MADPNSLPQGESPSATESLVGDRWTDDGRLGEPSLPKCLESRSRNRTLGKVTALPLSRSVFIGLFFLARLLRADDLAARVIVLANSADSDSVRLAHYYAEKRGVPANNILDFAMPIGETITWPEFVSQIWQPLQDELVSQHWIDAISSSLHDEVGRKKYAINGHRLAYLVLCRGVPLRISHDPALQPAPGPNGLPEAFRTNQAAVDSELALLAENRPPITGYIVNPLFHEDQPTAMSLGRVIKVARLDGPTYEDARGLVDRALLAERDGLRGRAYVDIGGIHEEGDRWLESTAVEIGQLGFDLEIDRERRSFGETTRSDAAALYFGWYEPNLNGPFALPGWRFAPGAVALHIHSYSAQTLRSASVGWTGPMVAHGVTATVGNVFEPYLQLTHRPDLLLLALARGDTFGDAAAYACPALSWQTIAVGDPLYRPFTVPLERQLQNRDSALADYAVLRQAHRWEKEDRAADALALLRREQVKTHALSISLALAERLEAGGEREAAAEILTTVKWPPTLRADEWALAEKVAAHMVTNGNPAVATGIYRRLFAEPLPANVRSSWLAKASKAATAAGDSVQAAAWQAETEKK
jgi:uncharacterized protein (TIGR03790 family)